MFEREKYIHSYIFDGEISLIMLIWGAIQGFSYLYSNKNLTIIFIEEILFLLCIVARERKIYQHNCIVKNGRIIYAEYDYVKTHCTSMAWRGAVRYLLHLYCTADGIMYKTQLEVGTDEGYINSVFELLKKEKIPIIVDEMGNYIVLIHELVLEHLWFNKPKKEDIVRECLWQMLGRYFALWLIIYVGSIKLGI